MYYDLHCHSNFSDGIASIGQIEEKCRRDGMGIVLTDHNEIRGAVKLFERDKIVTIPALEAGSVEGLEFLMYFKSVEEIEEFYKAAIEPYRVSRYMVRMNIKTEKLLDMAQDYTCFISLAHPYGFGKKSLTFHRANKRLIHCVKDHIDAVEIVNGNTRLLANEKAQYLSKHWNAKITVGSDGHDLKSIGKISAIFQDSNDIQNSHDLFEKIAENNIEAIKKEKGISKIKTGTIIARAHTKYFFGKNMIMYRKKAIEKANKS